MVKRVKIDGVFHSVARFGLDSSCWEACLAGLDRLETTYIVYKDGFFPGVDNLYPYEISRDDRYIHYWTSDETITHIGILSIGREKLLEDETVGAAILKLVQPVSDLQPEVNPVSDYNLGRFGSSITEDVHIGVA